MEVLSDDESKIGKFLLKKVWFLFCIEFLIIRNLKKKKFINYNVYLVKDNEIIGEESVGFIVSYEFGELSKGECGIGGEKGDEDGI